MVKLKKDYSLGVKAGLLTGLIFGIVGLVYYLFTVTTVVQAAGMLTLVGFSTGKIWAMFYLLMPALVIFMGLTWGLWFGVLYTALINIIPYRLYGKSTILAVVLWFLVSGIWNMAAGSWGYFLLSLLIWVLFGLVFAFFYKVMVDKMLLHQKGLDRLVARHSRPKASKKPSRKKRKRRR